LKRKYIVAVLLLLTLGVVSTLALTYQTGTLTENWDTIYTLQYGTSDLSLSAGSNLVTDLGASATDNVMSVTIPSSCASAVTPALTVTPLDTNGDFIYTDATGGTFQITVTLVDSSDGVLDEETITITLDTGETWITGTATFSDTDPDLPSSDIAEVQLSFSFPSAANFGLTGGPYSSKFEAIYEGMEITVEDA